MICYGVTNVDIGKYISSGYTMLDIGNLIWIFYDDGHNFCYVATLDSLIKIVFYG